MVIDRSLTIWALSGPEGTVIDGRAPTRPDTLSAICVLYSDPKELVVDGFTIRNGSGSTFAGLTASSGGGLFLAQANGNIKNCVIEDNEVEGDGGGIYMVSSSLTITDSVIRGNRANAGGALAGFLSALVLERSTVEQNVAAVRGILIVGSAEVTDCVMRGNRQSGPGHMIFVSFMVMRRTLVVGNGGTEHGITFLGAASGVIDQSTVVGNDCTAIDVGPMFQAISHVVVANNTGRGLQCSVGTELECNDIFENALGDELCGTDLGGNIHLDPQLCADYSPSTSSPCAPAKLTRGMLVDWRAGRGMHRSGRGCKLGERQGALSLAMTDRG